MSPDRYERAASAGGRGRARRSALHLRNGALPGLWPASFHQSIEPQIARRKRGIADAVSARVHPRLRTMQANFRFGTLVGAAQPSHREFDVAIGQFAPAFDTAHIGGLGITGEEVARTDPRFVARQGEGLAQIAVIHILPPAGHPVGEIARARDHVATPDTYRRA